LGIAAHHQPVRFIACGTAGLENGRSIRLLAWQAARELFFDGRDLFIGFEYRVSIVLCFWNTFYLMRHYMGRTISDERERLVILFGESTRFEIAERSESVVEARLSIPQQAGDARMHSTRREAIRSRQGV
jgi:hypothetical protein